MTALLEVRELSVRFATETGPALVLDRVNLGLRAGEIMGLVGESGCGKTTLARAVLGVLPGNAAIATGAITLDGTDLLTADTQDIRGRVITFIPQDPASALSPLFTVGDQIAELMRWKSPFPRRESRARTLAMLRDVQLQDPERLLRKYPHELSGGQRQRVMIAMAMLPEPRLIIADEPTTALDVTIQAQILKLLRRLAVQHRTTVLFTTHDLGTAWEICDRVTVMYAGQDAETADVAEFFAHPRHPYTAMLLASLPTQGAALAGIPGDVPSPFAPPPGCRFHPRCPDATEVCARARGPNSVPSPGHSVHCHHPRAA